MCISSLQKHEPETQPKIRVIQQPPYLTYRIQFYGTSDPITKCHPQTTCKALPTSLFLSYPRIATDGQT